MQLNHSVLTTGTLASLQARAWRAASKQHHEPLNRNAGDGKFAALCAGVPEEKLQRPISQLDVQTMWREAPMWATL